MFCEKAEKSWSGKWIWGDENGLEKNIWYLFRKEIELHETANTIIYISAVKRYRLYINGEMIGSGPPLSQPFNQYYDTYDVSNYMNQGKNSIALEVNFFEWGMDNRGALLLECINGGKIIAATDENWKTSRGKAWSQFTDHSNDVVGYEEAYDARLEPKGWKLPEFDDSLWNRSFEIRGANSDTPPSVYPWICLKPRDIPFMKEEVVYAEKVISIHEAVDLEDVLTKSLSLSKQLSMDNCKALEYSLVEGDENLLTDEKGFTLVQNSVLHMDIDNWFDGVYNPCLILDMGKIITGYIELEIDGDSGAIIDIGYSERLVEGQFRSSVGEVGFADRYTTKTGLQKFRTFYWKSFRYLKIRIKDCFKPIKIIQLKGIFNTYPYENRGSFGCKDVFYNKLWSACKNTIQLCSNEFMMDTPWREQRQWLGDVSAVTLGGIYSAFGDELMPSKYLKQCACGQSQSGILSMIGNEFAPGKWKSREIPDFSLWWIRAIWNHYMFTGDERFIHTYYPHVVKIMQFFENSKDTFGLIQDMGLWIFIDWADIDKRGECAALNALYIGILGYIEKMARFKNDIYIVEYCERNILEMSEKFNKRFWCEDKGVYIDSFHNEKLGINVSEHSNIFAILFGIASEDRTKRIIQSFYEEKNIKYTEAAPFVTFFVLNALYNVGRIDLSIRIMKERWGRMISHGATTVWEEWGMYGSWRNGKKYFARWRSLTHAWSAGPLEFLTKNIVGFDIITPGCGKIKLTPADVGIGDYNITIPTPKGDIKVSFENGVYHKFVPKGINILEI